MLNVACVSCERPGNSYFPVNPEVRCTPKARSTYGAPFAALCVQVSFTRSNDLSRLCADADIKGGGDAGALQHGKALP